MKRLWTSRFILCVVFAVCVMIVMAIALKTTSVANLQAHQEGAIPGTSNDKPTIQSVTTHKHVNSLQKGERTLPPGTIDGEKTPELISDFKAYEVFFHSVAISATSSDAMKATSKDKFRRAGLDDQDTFALINILGEFHHRRSQLNIKLAELRRENASRDKFSELGKEANDLVALAQQKVKERLSGAGVSKLHNHVMSLKTKIKILPPPATSGTVSKR